MKNFRADLHAHSTCSDGTLTPEELIHHAKEKGLTGISITDHDTVNAYRTAIPAAKKAGILLGSGVEFSSMNEGLSIHILGYDFDVEDSELLSFCQRHIQRRLDRNQRIIERLAKKGMRIDAEKIQREVEKGHPSGRPHIALALLEAGFVHSLQQAFNQYIGDGKCCFDPGMPMTTDETIEVIHHAGGKAFIAHPHLIHKNREVEKLLEKPFDGVECYYSKCSPNQEKQWVRVAREKGLLMSGGSDFHGAIKPNIPLGCSWVDEETFYKIFQNHIWQ